MYSPPDDFELTEADQTRLDALTGVVPWEVVCYDNYERGEAGGIRVIQANLKESDAEQHAKNMNLFMQATRSLYKYVARPAATPNKE